MTELTMNVAADLFCRWVGFLMWLGLVPDLKLFEDN